MKKIKNHSITNIIAVGGRYVDRKKAPKNWADIAFKELFNHDTYHREGLSSSDTIEAAIAILNLGDWQLYP